MSCPPDKQPLVAQFDKRPDDFWAIFKRSNFGKDEAQLRTHFDKKYGECFAPNAGIHSAGSSFDLSEEKMAAVRSCMLKI